MKITMAQLNPIAGDIKGAVKKVTNVLLEFGAKSDLVVFPELFLLGGYPPKEFLEKEEFITRLQNALDKIVKLSNKYPETGILIGTVIPTGNSAGKKFYNSAVLILKGKILGVRHKTLLPAYDMFDETRYFEPALEVEIIAFKERNIGVSICEDMGDIPGLWRGRPYTSDPIQKLARLGAELFINIAVSPFCAGKEEERYKLIQTYAKEYKTPFLFVNQVGGNDELIFDGRSIYVNEKGEVVSVFPGFKEHVETVDIAVSKAPVPYVPQEKTESIYNALILGLTDYLKKRGFSKAVIGISGGIDSAVTCVLAKEALGPKDVLAIFMPSPYSSEQSAEYSRVLAQNLGVQLKTVSISQIYFSYLQALREDLKIDVNKKVEVYLQNIQARIRGNILMAFSNRFGYFPLVTGNKSEVEVGYCTLYGDTAGGLAVISDVPKTMVYALADYINRNGGIIPHEIIEREPSAELKPEQFDQETLPPYDILDKILCYMEEGYSSAELEVAGFQRDMVKWVIETVNKNKFKKRQLPPGLRVTRI